MQEKIPDATPLCSELVGDHPVLDWLNTVLMMDGNLVDTLRSDEDVLQTMHSLGWSVPQAYAGQGDGKLLLAARELREDVRNLLVSRKGGKRINLTLLNATLREARSFEEVISLNGALQIHQVWEQQNVTQVLGPVAASAASLLTEENLDLVRNCESDNCVLWFYDRTKSHRRRWCSMTTCGNRHKVAAFRKRQG